MSRRKKNLHLRISTEEGWEQEATLRPGKIYSVGGESASGRKPADIVIPDSALSGKQCEIRWINRKGWVLRPLNTTVDTKWNGEIVTDSKALRLGNTIQVGTTKIVVQAPTKSDGTVRTNRNRDLQTNAGNELSASDETIDVNSVSASGIDEAMLSLVIQPHRGAEQTVRLDTTKKRYVLGRKMSGKNKGVDFLVPDKHVSRRHCAIRWLKTKGWMIKDLGTTNGTYLDGELITGERALADGRKINIGTTRIVASISAETAPEETAVDLDATAVSSELSASETDPTDGVEDGTTAVLLEDPGKTKKTGAKADKAKEKDGDIVTSTKPALTKRLDSFPKGDSKENENRPPDPVLLGLVKDLVRKNLIENQNAIRLVQRAQDRGKTFFRTLADSDEVRFKSEIYDHVSSDCDHTVIRDEGILEQEVISVEWLPLNVAERRGMLALEPTNASSFRFAVLDPYDIGIDDWIARHVELDLEKVLVTPEAFHPVINRLKNRIDDEEVGEIGLAINITSDQERWIRSNIGDIDIPQMVNYFIHRGFVQGASDVHIEPMEDTLVARNRIDGVLHEDSRLPHHIHPEVVSRIKIMSGMDVAEKRRPQDGRIGLVIRGSPIDVRVSSYPTVYGEKIVLRLLDKNSLRPTPEALGLLAGGLRVLKDKINAPYGLIMISGPTGSGKTTTLYSCLGSIDKNAKNVLTIEDPVEYRLMGVHQMQVNEKIGLTFASGLRTILRQDPDVVMIGECRDVETSAMAIQASLTGHIVFSTIHTNDAIGVITRLLDMRIDPFLVANALSLAVAQRLVRRICNHCATEVRGADILETLYMEGVSNERLNSLGIDVDPEFTYTNGSGCIRCNNTGYLGRQAVFEVFEMTSEARTMIMSDNFSADQLRNRAIETGMVPLVQHGLRLVDEGITTHEEVLRVLGEAS